MITALLYLEFHTIRNRLLARLKRLRQPKYLVGGIVGALYFYFYFFRSLFGMPGRRGGMPFASTPQNQALYEAIGATILFVILLLAWLVPHERAALAFSEAEVTFLFPAPISRRGLIHFKLLRSQAGILFATFILMLVTRRFGGRVWIHAAGWWIILSTLNLHLLGSSFGRTMLLERGITNWQRRVIIFGLVLSAVVVCVVWTKQTLPRLDLSEPQNGTTIKLYVQELLHSGPLPWLLYPWRLVVRPYLANDGAAFVRALGPALALLALHYWWVIRSNVSFEEASVEASRRTAEKVAAIRAGKWQGSNRKLKVKRAPFKLSARGPAPVALLWKNLISAGQAFTLRAWLLLAFLGISMSIGLGQSAVGENLGTGLGMAAGMLSVWTFLLGPQIFRQDFRQDLPLADLLKAYPLPGWQIALGELLAPVVILTGVQWVLLLAAAALVSRTPFGDLGPGGMVAICFGAALLAPMLNLLTLQIPNAAVLLFPAWFQSGKLAAQGIEATGQRIIFLFGQLLVFLLAMLPAFIAFLLVFLVLRMVLGVVLAIPFASGAATLVLGIEAAIGLLLLGKLFERLDISAEPLV